MGTSGALAIELLHGAVPGRLRYAVSQLKRSTHLAAPLERALQRFGFVHEARASASSGTLLVLFAPETSKEEIERAILASLHEAEDTSAAAPHSDLRSAEPKPPRDRILDPPTPAKAGSPLFHALTLDEVMVFTRSGRHGLTTDQARARLDTEGLNALRPPEKRGELKILFDQFASTPVAMLAVSAVLSASTGGIGDAAAILVVLAINATIGYVTESGAERTIMSLTRTSLEDVPVLRNGSFQKIPVADIVSGDVLALSAGTFVPADSRLLDTDDLTIDESALTGESMPVSKYADEKLERDMPLAGRVNMAYRGTLVTGGAGHGLVVATGERTEVGQIQSLASGVEQRATPMQQQLDKLGRQLATVAGVACAATMGVGLLRGQAFLPMFRTAISLAVAAVPEGLPTVAITTLALGLSRMREERVIIRQLAAVETLGSVQVLCVDKTGTLTQNRMAVVELSAGLTSFCVRGGHIEDALGSRSGALGKDLEQLLRVSALCTEVELDEQRGVCVLRGSPTESALVQLAMDAGLDMHDLRRRHPVRAVQRRAEHRNYMSTLHDVDGGQLLAVKGRPSEVLSLCAHLLHNGKVEPLSEASRAQIEDQNEQMAARALRVLGVACLERSSEAAGESGLPPLVWLGHMGMEDPPRPEVREVMASLRRAGVRTVMITGDQSGTAQALAKSVGLSDGGHVEIIDSTRLERVDPELLSSLAQRAHVFSRVSPAHKLQIVQALQRAGLVVAMTGDGINDGPALKAADIGVAMGAGGTAVAREVADVVLEDDQLTTLVNAIQQGRTTYDDIRKAVHFILATNLSEILYTFTCVAAGLGEPLSPLQLLWINLITDVFPELALAVQPSESDVLARPPRDPGRPMFSQRDFIRITSEGTFLTMGSLGAYLWASRGAPGPSPRASTMGFTTLTLAQLLHAMSARSEHHTIFDREHLANNPWLGAAVGGTIALQLCASFIPGLRALLGTVPLRPADWVISLSAAVVPFLCNEAIKLTLRSSPPLERTSSLKPSLVE